jgi:hypothetical protein
VATNTITVLMPHTEREGALKGKAPRLFDLKGKRIGFLDNLIWTSTKTTFQEFEQVLRSEYGIAEAVHEAKSSQQAPASELEAFAKRVDAAIVGMAN